MRKRSETYDITMIFRASNLVCVIVFKLCACVNNPILIVKFHSSCLLSIVHQLWCHVQAFSLV